MKIKVTHRNQVASLLLRIGLAIVLLYASIASLVSPDDWIGYLPHIFSNYSSGHELLKVLSLYQAILAVWLLSGVFRKPAVLLAALTFSGILLSNLNLFAITFRDIPMVFASLALIFIDSD